MAFLLTRAYAYAVKPQKTGDFVAGDGGVVKAGGPMRDIIEAAHKRIAAGDMTRVDFHSFEGDRKHLVRDEVMLLAFGATAAPKGAAARLAKRLAQSMDNRSTPCLLVLALEADNVKRRLTMMLLPSEDVIRLQNSGEEILLDLLDDAFSTGSAFRKIAQLEGHDAKTQFLSAQILDLQFQSPDKTAADFWVRDFLVAKPSISSDSGTIMLASALRRALEAAPEGERDAVFAAMHKAGSGRVRGTTLAKYAEEIPSDLFVAYYRGLEKAQITASFEVSVPVIKSKLGRRIIVMTDGTVVSVPEAAIGKTVEVRSEAAGRIVEIKAKVRDETMKKARGKGVGAKK